MKIFLSIMCLVLGLQNLIWGCVVRDKRAHIEVLENYIRDNNLPVPAYPLKNGKVAFEIEVPICQ